MNDSRTHCPPGPELGILHRCREWTDVLPWLRLTRVLRLGGSPVWILAVLAVGWLWRFFSVRMFGEPFGARLDRSPWLSLSLPGDWLIPLPRIGMDEESMPDSKAIFWDGDAAVFILWTLFCWTPIAMMLSHLGGQLTAGRELPDFSMTAKNVLPRVVRGWFAAALPVAVALPFLFAIAGLHALVRWLDVEVVTQMSSPLLAVVSFAASLLIVVGKVAVPLAWASLAIESKPDAVDCLSRGYEYVLRRAPQTILLVIVAAVQVTLVVAMMEIVTWGAEWLDGRLAGSPVGAEASSRGWVATVTRSVTLTLGWGMIGGIYLLLRQSAGGQEVEDVDRN